MISLVIAHVISLVIAHVISLVIAPVISHVIKHDLSHLLSVSLRIKRCLTKKNRILLRSNTKLVVESVMPDLFHIVPVADNTMLNEILQSKDYASSPT